jgi:hypothetical protein
MSNGDLDLNIGRWLAWGVLAIAALALIVFFFIRLGDETEPTAASTLLPGGGEQVEWTIDVGEYAPAPGVVTLKGDTPLGFPTETWKDGVMLARSVDAGQFEWNMDVTPEVPLPVFEIDEAATCDTLNELLNEWASATGSAFGDAQRAQAEAFAQHALDTMVDQGCEPSLES